MPQLKIKELTLKNFRSFGEIETRVNLYNLGPLLIVGCIDDDSSHSNGSGKSSMAEAITWCLFGRLSRKDRPADNMINWFTKKNCEVSILTEDGYKITRTRGTHNDLLIQEPNGNDVSDAITKNAQKHLNQLFNLDYGIFATSVFFGQYNDSFLESPETKRRKTLERLLGLLKFDYYAVVAKEEVATFELEQAKYTGSISHVEREIIRISQQIEKHNDDLAQFETQRQERVKETQSRLSDVDGRCSLRVKEFTEKLKQAQSELTAIKLFDIDQLRKKWKEYEEKLQIVASSTEKIDEQKALVSKLETERQTLADIKTTDYNKNTSILKAKLKTALEEYNQTPDGNEEQIKQAWEIYNQELESLVEPRTTTITLEKDIIKLATERDLIITEIEQLKEQAGSICSTCKQKVGKDHVHTLSDPLKEKLTKLDNEIAKSEELLKRANVAIQKKAEKNEAQKPAITIQEARLTDKNKQAKYIEAESIRTMLTETQNRIKIAKESEKQISERIATIRAEVSYRLDEIKEAEAQNEKNIKNMEANKPSTTVNEAQLIKSQYDSKQREIISIEIAIKESHEHKEKEKDDIRGMVTQIQKETNPYNIIIDDLKTELAILKQNRINLDEKINQYNEVIKHLEYIRLTYADKKRLKAHVLSKYIPYFNERISYYLDAFDCSQYKLEFNSFLQAKTDKWPYDYWSGGECKRIDLAIMFAMYDLHTTIHGQICNVLVFDEVDSRLDRHGVQLFANLIFKDFATENRTILVISHKDELRDLFPTKMLIKKTGDLSTIEEIR